MSAVYLWCYGGGHELSLASDRSLPSERARLGKAPGKKSLGRCPTPRADVIAVRERLEPRNVWIGFRCPGRAGAGSGAALGAFASSNSVYHPTKEGASSLGAAMAGAEEQ